LDAVFRALADGGCCGANVLLATPTDALPNLSCRALGDGGFCGANILLATPTDALSNLSRRKFNAKYRFIDESWPKL
jgi:hypothetical protein